MNNNDEISDSHKSFKRITVAEPQGENHDNSWHLHILLIFNVSAPFIINEMIANLWKHGITDTHKIYDAEGLALYFKAYLSDIEYTEEPVVDGLVDKTKNVVEGMRYGFADFESAGVVKETMNLPEDMWNLSDAEQFKWLDEQIGGGIEGYTCHHTEIFGKMKLVPTGLHNITTQRWKDSGHVGRCALT